MRKKVLVVCKGNACRSPMLKALLHRACQERNLDVQVESAGFSEKEATRNEPATDKSVVCMDRVGIDIRNHKRKWSGSLNLDSYDLVVAADQKTFCALLEQIVEHSKLVLANPPVGIPNPWGKPQEAYDECARIMTEVVIPQLMMVLDHPRRKRK